MTEYCIEYYDRAATRPHTRNRVVGLALVKAAIARYRMSGMKDIMRITAPSSAPIEEIYEIKALGVRAP